VGMPQEITYDISRLSEIVGKDREAVVAFYGGEPLLRTDVVKSFLYSLPARKFVLQTNGYFVRELGDDVGKFDTILLSIDGRKEITDRYRAPGCYDKVMDALHFLREKGYGGDIRRKNDCLEIHGHIRGRRPSSPLFSPCPLAARYCLVSPLGTGGIRGMG